MLEKSGYIHYLKSKDFIRWQLSPDEELSRYWELYQAENPESVIDIKKAIDVLKADTLNKKRLEQEEVDLLLAKIENTLKYRKRARKKKRSLIMSFSAVAAIIIALFVFKTRFVDTSKSGLHSIGNEQITGSLLESKDVQLITKEEQFTFGGDVQIKVDKRGNTKVTQINEEKGAAEKTLKESFLKLIVPYGKRSTLLLADGSKVWLNSGAILEFPSKFEGKTRDVFLASGEIYIEVVKDAKRPFKVHTSDFGVKVYGTKFNVSKYSNEPSSIILVEGKIGLALANSKEKILLPSEQATITDEQTIETHKIDVERFISWKDGYLSFNKTPISEVLQQISRYYNLSFDYSKDINLHKRTCTGKIYLSENLDNVMHTVALLSNTTYYNENNKIYITNSL